VSQWVESISTVIRKTEMNLSLVGHKPAYLDVSLERAEDLRPRDTESSFVDVQRELRAVKSALEKTVSDTATAHKHEVEELMTRLAEAEVRHRSGSSSVGTTQALQEQEKLRTQFESVLEQKSQELQSKFKDFVTKAELQSAENALKQVHLQDQQLLERKVQTALSDLESARSQSKREVDAKVQALSSQLVRSEELDQVKTQLLQHIDSQVKKIEADLRAQLATLQTDLLAHCQSRLDVLKTSLRGDLQTAMRESEGQLEELSQTLEDLKKQMQKQRNESNAKVADLSESAERLAAENERNQGELRRLRAVVESLPEDNSEEYFTQLSSKLKEVERRLMDVPNEEEELRLLEERVQRLEAGFSEDSMVTDNADFEISAGEVVPPDKPEGLATFGKGKEPKPISPQPSSEYMTITLNEMESDDADSADYVSPHISPMNRIPAHPSMLQKAEEVKVPPVDLPSKHFDFDTRVPPVHSVIAEASHEDETDPESSKIGRVVGRFCAAEVEAALALAGVEDHTESEAFQHSLEEFDLP